MKYARLLGALAAVVTVCACSRDGAGNSTADLGAARVAVVNGRPIPESVLRIYVRATERQDFDAMSPADRERVINDVIGLELLAQQAEKDGLTASRTLAAQIELQRLQAVARAMATEYLKDNPPTDADIQAIYEENLPRLSGEQYKLRHILVETKAEADTVIAQLNQGSDFVALARERADGPTGPNDGDLGWLTADSLPPSFAEAVRALTAGSYSPTPVQTDAGYHVILLEDKQRQEPPALEDIRADVSSAAERKRLDDYIKTLRERATVSIDQ
jgi:peptidyl-prolyl cis-trans isomerase C